MLQFAALGCFNFDARLFTIESVENADVYRCFVRDSWLGGGMLWFRKLVGIP